MPGCESVADEEGIATLDGEEDVFDRGADSVFDGVARR